MSNDPNRGLRFDYEDSVRRFRQDLDQLGREVFPRTMATLMNRATAGVKRRLDEYTLRAVDKPNAYTKKAWYYVQAKWQDGDRMWSEVRARETQAHYLWFLVNGGRRVPGDIGTNRSAKDMFAFTAQLSPYDGIDRKYVKKLGRQLKAERRRRTLYRGKREALVAQGLPQDKQTKRMAKLRWVHVAKGDPGIFFGTIHGVKGFWRRPERLSGDERQSIVDAARSRPTRPNTPTGRSGIGYTKPGSKAELLVAEARGTKYQETFDYDGQVHSAYAEHMTEAAFQASMAYERRRARMLNDART
ncbi:hypothetical protein [Ensifer aridi]|uniref:hypothetical protein n=1 Tax=Ensifer aridi TaxID=1708715 RepID=UPI00041C5949|nr:hypothetical protein [Ensifer aridi]